MTDKPEPSAFEKFGRMHGKILRGPKEDVEREAKKEEVLKEKDYPSSPTSLTSTTLSFVGIRIGMFHIIQSRNSLLAIPTPP